MRIYDYPVDRLLPRRPMERPVLLAGGLFKKIQPLCCDLSFRCTGLCDMIVQQDSVGE